MRPGEWKPVDGFATEPSIKMWHPASFVAPMQINHDRKYLVVMCEWRDRSHHLRDKIFLTFAQAREFARSLGLPAQLSYMRTWGTVFIQQRRHNRVVPLPD